MVWTLILALIFCLCCGLKVLISSFSYCLPNNCSLLTIKFRWICRGDRKYKPNPRLARVLDILFILHAEHEMNCSTAAARHLASRYIFYALFSTVHSPLKSYGSWYKLTGYEVLQTDVMSKWYIAVGSTFIQHWLEQQVPCMGHCTAVLTRYLFKRIIIWDTTLYIS